ADLELALLAVRQRSRWRLEAARQPDGFGDFTSSAERAHHPRHRAEEAEGATLTSRRGQSQVLEHAETSDHVVALGRSRDAQGGGLTSHGHAPRRRLGSPIFRSCHRSPRRRGGASARPFFGHFTTRLVAAAAPRLAMPLSVPMTPPGAKSTKKMKVSPRMSIHRSV